MNILVIGGGGREHCLVWKISKSSLVEKIYAAPGNAGISEIAECIDIDISKNNFNGLLKLVEDRRIDLTVVGPEAPLVWRALSWRVSSSIWATWLPAAGVLSV